MIETAVVFSRSGEIIHWHQPKERSQFNIADSRELWDVIWAHRVPIGGIAHTHPWHGKALPSTEDVTTFNAIERGIGRRLVWPIVTLDDVGYFAVNSAWKCERR